ncbi:protein kinase [Gammaproteobacteria bacterium]|nr:protein kinase [Gammaproteobacteria bacterium]
MRQENLKLELEHQQLAEHTWNEQGRLTAFKWAESQFKDGNHFQKISRQKATNVDPKSLYSFIKLNGIAYATLPKNKKGILGQGSYGKVRIAIDKDGKQYALKVEQVRLDNQDTFATLSNEMQITYDQWLGVTDQRFYREHTKGNNQIGKYYSLQEIKGEELFKYLQNNKNLDEKTRLEIAINVCKAVDDLHTGRSSKTNTPYAHLDLKPENILIDKDLNVQIIDFGMATSGVDKQEGLMGSPAYIPQNYQHATCRQRDIYALQRILYVKDSYQNIYKGELNGYEQYSLLTMNQFNSLNDVLETAENKTTNKEIRDIDVALKKLEKTADKLKILNDNDIQTLDYIQMVHDDKLTTENLNENMITVLKLNKIYDLDLDFNTLQALAKKGLNTWQFKAVSMSISILGSNVPEINEQKNELQKMVYTSMKSENPSKNLEGKIESFISSNKLNKHKAPIKRGVMHALYALTGVGTIHTLVACRSTASRQSFFGTKRTQEVRQAVRKMKSGKYNIRTALRAG